MIICAMVKSRVLLGIVIPPLIGNPCNGYINPYYWVDDHPLLYGNNGSLDPGTYIFLYACVLWDIDSLERVMKWRTCRPFRCFFHPLKKTTSSPFPQHVWLGERRNKKKSRQQLSMPKFPSTFRVLRWEFLRFSSKATFYCYAYCRWFRNPDDNRYIYYYITVYENKVANNNADISGCWSVGPSSNDLSHLLFLLVWATQNYSWWFQLVCKNMAIFHLPQNMSVQTQPKTLHETAKSKVKNLNTSFNHLNFGPGWNKLFKITLPETNSLHLKNQWLEDEISCLGWLTCIQGPY